jgi:hypothetical protein
VEAINDLQSSKETCCSAFVGAPAAPSAIKDMQSLKETCKETCGLACEGAQTKIRQQPSSK